MRAGPPGTGEAGATLEKGKKEDRDVIEMLLKGPGVGGRHTGSRVLGRFVRSVELSGSHKPPKHNDTCSVE